MTWMSTLGKTTVVKGEVHAAEGLRIDGAVEGRVVCEHQAIVFGETAQITGDVIARDVTVFGQITGQIVATDVVDLRPGAVVTGQALSPRFILDPDAFFKGRVEPQHVEAALRVAKFNEKKR